MEAWRKLRVILMTEKEAIIYCIYMNEIPDDTGLWSDQEQWTPTLIRNDLYQTPYRLIVDSGQPCAKSAEEKYNNSIMKLQSRLSALELQLQSKLL
ncbi:hypothetical protein KUTeg_012573 [Tegillarca granosa]|uniref:Uncharacterized protein n=1 Tax=Tegillarca granosa TaxID=220873 RepID=A0ABQ9F561_TEGGR|nr:hypothetical protein KUTeg_012573 [Tegillarca granosa]